MFQGIRGFARRLLVLGRPVGLCAHCDSPVKFRDVKAGKCSSCEAEMIYEVEDLGEENES